LIDILQGKDKEKSKEESAEENKDSRDPPLVMSPGRKQKLSKKVSDDTEAIIMFRSDSICSDPINLEKRENLQENEQPSGFSEIRKNIDNSFHETNQYNYERRNVIHQSNLNFQNQVLNLEKEKNKLKRKNPVFFPKEKN